MPTATARLGHEPRRLIYPDLTSPKALPWRHAVAGR